MLLTNELVLYAPTASIPRRHGRRALASSPLSDSCPLSLQLVQVHLWLCIAGFLLRGLLLAVILLTLSPTLGDHLQSSLACHFALHGSSPVCGSSTRSQALRCMSSARFAAFQTAGVGDNTCAGGSQGCWGGPQSTFSSGDTGLRLTWGHALAHCESACRAFRQAHTRWLLCRGGRQCCSMQHSTSAGFHLGSCHCPATTCDGALAV